MGGSILFLILYRLLFNLIDSHTKRSGVTRDYYYFKWDKQLENDGLEFAIYFQITIQNIFSFMYERR